VRTAWWQKRKLNITRIYHQVLKIIIMEYRQTTPDDEIENECSFCKNPCEDTYCSTECKKAELND